MEIKTSHLKKVIVLFLIFSIQGYKAQSDSINKVDIELLQSQVSELLAFKRQTEPTIQAIQLNLKQFHKVYVNGIVLVIIGGVLTSIAYPISNTMDSPELGQALAFGGITFSIIGVWKIVRSHRYIGKAGKFTTQKTLND